MLKTLTLSGFKSFADRTEFHFSRGITGIVGPNGSGKSNVVDAVKWVLGEQSAKSLRGGEMTDVIFNGSASRRSLGLAEVTMVFDNTRRVLATDSEEVQITRRVYRSGESEYLINSEVCRLKDIKQLFLGSGAGTDAYCIIEQGRVDVLLQASTKDRRTIFEEAAGISRFKAKKVETLRRLERVDQNVQRLKDIIDEVETQLRSVKLQAAKAQRYQEYTQRLRELRVGLGLQEYHEITRLLSAEVEQLETLRAELAQALAQASEWERDLAQLEEDLRRSEDETRSAEGRLAVARQKMAAEESTLTHETGLSADLEQRRRASLATLVDLENRVTSLTEVLAQVTGDLREAEGLSAEQRRGVQHIEDELQRVVLRVALLQKQAAADKGAHYDQMREVAHLQNVAVDSKARLDGLTQARDRAARRGEQAAEGLAAVDLQLQALAQADEELQARLSDARLRLANQRQEREQLRHESEETAARVGDLRARRSGVASRIEVLEGLERSHEGVGTGGREVLALVAGGGTEPWGSVVGMIADLITVRREDAALVDVALGERAQRFLVRDVLVLDQALAERPQPFAGRVTFLSLSAKSPPGSVQSAEPSPLASAASLVTCDIPELEDLPRQLLGDTLLVPDLPTARALVAQGGVRCVTRQGEVLETDGTLTVGTHHAEAGILSRKSELRELRGQITQIERAIAEAERHLAHLRGRVAALDAEAVTLQQEVDVLAEQAAERRSLIGQHRQRREELHEQVVDSQSELGALTRDIDHWQAAWEKARTLAEMAEIQVQELQARIEAGERELREREAGRESLQSRCTEAKVALAQSEERLNALRARHRQTTGDLEQRHEERRQASEALTSTDQRLKDSLSAMLAASSALAQAYAEKENVELQLRQMVVDRDRFRAERQQRMARSQEARGAWQDRQEQAHARGLRVNDLQHRHDALVSRLAEDYQIDLPALSREQETPRTGEESAILDPTQVNEEIEDLRRKLSRLGSVNLDALEELARHELRAATLQAQYDDLASAKRVLEEIIAKINEDSRKLFGETFSAIRTNFQELFRKLFGGGMADIVLEDEADILESGIEIVARPPGKELRSISLMSGGEKTMTAVALLLAIFRSKPSPFCILDEVDAALDEANIGRYASVLRDFLDRSHFIIITHSKRTMSACDVIYGVTMQESGISKRVAVRFEDYPEDPTEKSEQSAPALGSFGGK